ncbi:MAG TPA: hypothetical protein VFS24_04575 [Steroidobacteraceae bacterium]|nr:hypothetical protein [Steroidobacteraceae bacterium]
MLTSDLMSRHQIVLHDVHGSTRWVSRGANAWFGGVLAGDLAGAVSVAFERAFAEMSAHIKARGMRMKQDLIEAAALRTIVSVFYVHKVNGEPLVLTNDDLSSSFARNECAEVCREAFGASYPVYAAALLGIETDAFLAWEEGQRRYVREIRS